MLISSLLFVLSTSGCRGQFSTRSSAGVKAQEAEN